MEFTQDDYVVRTGWRGIVLPLLWVLGWIALSAGLWLAHWRPGVWRDLVLLAAGAALVAECVRRARLALQRKVVFTVHSGGIYFGDGLGPQNVPWSRICAVELFRERIPQLKSQTVYHCIGVRSPGAKQVQRPGNGPAARPVPDRSVACILAAVRPDLIPGHDGTVRHAYRRMVGWRVNRSRLAKAVHRYAPEVPVIDGPDYPPSLRWGEGLRAKRSVSR